MRLFTLFLFLSKFTFAQCLLKEVSFKNKSESSSIVVEGKVLYSKSFWNEKKDFIYTKHHIEVYKILKGGSKFTELDVITEGGTIGEVMHRAEPSLVLMEGDIGIFFLNHSEKLDFKKETEFPFLPFAGPQGFILYDQITEGATTPFKKYENIPKEIYEPLQSLTGRPYLEIKPSGNLRNGSGSKSTVSIGNFSPTALSAGTGSILTINGSGFGNSQGSNSYVEFRNANDGGASFVKPLNSEYVSWNDTQIEVKVPSYAGTGNFRVVVNGVVTMTQNPLLVNFSHLNAVTGGTAYEVFFINQNNGGYEWRMSTSFNAKAQAKESFKRSFQNWRCGTYVNWSLGSTTTINATASDGINIIRFDIGNELPTGVLGVCYTYWSGCVSGNVYSWFVNELDIVFDDATNWNYGPDAPLANQIDFESVAVHELGHGHQLGHVINSNEIMHYSMSYGQSKRALSPNDLSGGNHVMKKSIGINTCLKGTMEALNSGSCSLTGTPVASVSINSGSNPACEGEIVTFTAVATNGGTSPVYQWKLNGGDIGSNANTFSSATLKNGDKVQCEMTSSLSGVQNSPAGSNLIAMVVNSNPDKPQVLQKGADSLVCSLNAMSYEWKYNNTTTVGTTKAIKPLLVGNYTVHITATNSCKSEVSTEYAYNPLNVERNGNGKTIKVYPNPNKGEFNILFTEITTDDIEVSITDILGRVVFDQEFTKGQNEIRLISGELENGMFFLHLKLGPTIIHERIMVQQ